MRHWREQRRQIQRRYNLQKLIRRIALQTHHLMRRVADGNAFFMQKIANQAFLKRLATRRNKIILIGKKHQPENPPHIVLKIRIIKIHLPARLRRRKTAQHQQLGVGRGERRQRMGFDGEIGHVIFSVVNSIIRQYRFRLVLLLAGVVRQHSVHTRLLPSHRPAFC